MVSPFYTFQPKFCMCISSKSFAVHCLNLYTIWWYINFAVGKGSLNKWRNVISEVDREVFKWHRPINLTSAGHTTLADLGANKCSVHNDTPINGQHVPEVPRSWTQWRGGIPWPPLSQDLDIKDLIFASTEMISSFGFLWPFPQYKTHLSGIWCFAVERISYPFFFFC